MSVILRIAFVILRGGIDKILRRRTPECAIVTALFKPHVAFPAAAKPAFRRIAQLSWRSLRLVVGGNDGGEIRKQIDTIVLWTTFEPDPLKYVTEYEDVGEVALVDQQACPNCLAYIARAIGAVLLVIWCAVSLSAPFLLGTVSAFDRILEVARTIRIVSYVRRIAPSRVFYYASYQRPGNLVAYLILAGSDTQVVRIPSPNPLSYHYTNCVSDEFIFTSPLQVVEYRRLQANWFVPTIRLWKPPGHVTFARLCYQSAPPGNKTIGLLNGGLWRRKERGDLFDEARTRQLHAEKELHLAIGDFLSHHADVKVTVYPHPSEKADPSVYARAQLLYTERVGADRVEIVGPDERTHHRFSDSNVFVAFWSTSALEALYCGHKVLFVRFGFPAYVDDPSLEHIHVHDRASLYEKLTHFLSISDDEYFKKYNLTAYRHDHYAHGPITIKRDLGDELLVNPLRGDEPDVDLDGSRIIRTGKRRVA